MVEYFLFNNIGLLQFWITNYVQDIFIDCKISVQLNDTIQSKLTSSYCHPIYQYICYKFLDNYILSIQDLYIYTYITITTNELRYLQLYKKIHNDIYNTIENISMINAKLLRFSRYIFIICNNFKVLRVCILIRWWVAVWDEIYY